MSKTRDLIEKIKLYFRFSPDELKGIIITILIIGFMLSFNDWNITGSNKFDGRVGTQHLIISLLVVAISILINLTVKRIAALNIGYRLEYRMWLPGLLFGLITCLILNTLFGGFNWGWVFIAPGSILLHHLVGHRLGFFRYGINLWSKSMIIIWGLVATMAVATLFKILYTSDPTNYFYYKMFVFNLVLAVFLALPIPPSDGAFVMYATRGIYTFVIGAVIGWAVLMYHTNISIALIGMVLLGIASLVVFFLVYETDFIK